MRQAQLRQVCWIGSISCMVAETIAHRRTPAKFLKLHPPDGWERLRKRHGLPEKAKSWMLKASLTLCVALQEVPPRPFHEIRKELRILIDHFR